MFDASNDDMLGDVTKSNQEKGEKRKQEMKLRFWVWGHLAKREVKEV